ncbi:MAG: hypothetical protein VCE75_19790 [Alphaproteobacteria bacterium]
MATDLGVMQRRPAGAVEVYWLVYFYAQALHFPTIEDEEMIPGHGLGIVFRREPIPGWHNCPRRQFVLVISGEAELGFGDGSTQRIRPGDICLMEDHTGQGHTTTAVEVPWLSIQIPVSMDAQIAI